MPQLHAPPDDSPEAADAALIEALTGIALAAARAAAEGPHSGGVGDARSVIAEALAEIAPRTLMIAENRAPGPHASLDGEILFYDVEVADPALDDANAGGLVLSIGVVRAGAPALGVVYATALGRLWTGRPDGAWAADAPPEIGVGPAAPISVRAAPEHGVTAIAESADSSPELEAFLNVYRASEQRTASAAVGFCRLAEGEADLFPHLGRSAPWSTAAGDAILRGAGGRTVTLDGTPLFYPASDGPGSDGERRFANPRFVALGSIGLKTPEPA